MLIADLDSIKTGFQVYMAIAYVKLALIWFKRIIFFLLFKMIIKSQRATIALFFILRFHTPQQRPVQVLYVIAFYQNFLTTKPIVM